MKGFNGFLPLMTLSHLHPTKKNNILYLINMQKLKTEDRNIIQRSMQEAAYEALTDKKLRVNQRKAVRG